MQITIAHPPRFLIFVLPIGLAVAVIGFSGGVSGAVRVGDASPEFVGNLIGTVHRSLWS